MNPEYDPAYYTSYDDGKGMGSIFCISAAKDDESAYETEAGGICTTAFLKTYSKMAGPANVRPTLAQGGAPLPPPLPSVTQTIHRRRCSSRCRLMQTSRACRNGRE